MKNFKKITFDIDENDIEDNLVDRVKEIMNQKIIDYKRELLSSLYYCESPIEQILSMEIVDLIKQYASSDVIDIVSNNNQEYIKCDDKTYRVDYLLEIAFLFNGEYKELIKLVVECDGHDFHEKTKEQVMSDNQRNRDIENQGYYILHFSGSELYHNSAKCRREINKFIKRKYTQFLQKQIEE